MVKIVKMARVRERKLAWATFQRSEEVLVLVVSLRPSLADAIGLLLSAGNECFSSPYQDCGPAILKGVENVMQETNACFLEYSTKHKAWGRSHSK